MKWLLPLIFIFSFTTQAQELDRSIRMTQLLENSGVRSWGWREYREANIVCKVPKRTGELICNLRAIPTYNESVFVRFTGTKATAISKLLKEFEIFPDGRDQRQDLQIECINNRNTSNPECSVVTFSGGIN